MKTKAIHATQATLANQLPLKQGLRLRTHLGFGCLLIRLANQLPLKQGLRR